MQTQLNDIVDNTGLPSPLVLESVDTPNIIPPETTLEQSIAPQSLKTSAIIKHARGNSIAQDSETQTELGEAAGHQLQKIHDQKFQIFQLRERVKELEGKIRYDQVLTNEKIRTNEMQIKSLTEDNARLVESLRQRSNQTIRDFQSQIKAKDNLIGELTNKLKESTRVIQSVKIKNLELKERIDNGSGREKSKTRSQQVEQLEATIRKLQDHIRRQDGDSGSFKEQLRMVQAQNESLEAKLLLQDANHEKMTNELKDKYEHELAQLQMLVDSRSPSKLRAPKALTHSDTMNKLHEEIVRKLQVDNQTLKEFNQEKDQLILELRAKIQIGSQASQDAQEAAKVEKQQLNLDKEKLMVELETLKSDIDNQVDLKTKAFHQKAEEDQQRLKQLQQELENAQKRLQQQTEELNTSVTEHNSSYVQQLDQQKILYEQASQKLEKKRVKLKEHREDIAKQKVEIEQLQSMLKTSNSTPDIKKVALQRSVSEKNPVSKVDEQAKQIKMLEQEKKKLQQDLKSVKQSRDQTPNKNQKVQEEVDKLVAQAEETANQHKSELEELEKQIADLKSQLEAAKADSQTLVTVKEKYETLAKKYEDQKKVIDQEKEKRKELTVKMARQAKENLLKHKDVQKQLKTSRESFQESRDLLVSREKKIEELQSRLSQSVDLGHLDLSQKKERLSDSQIDINPLISLEKEHEQNKQSQEHKSLVDNLRKELDDARREKEDLSMDLQKQLDERAKELESLKTEYERVSQQLNQQYQKTNRNEEQDPAEEDLKSQIEKLREQLETEQKEKDRLRRDMRNKLEDAEDQAKETTKAKDAIIDQMKQARVQDGQKKKASDDKVKELEKQLAEKEQRLEELLLEKYEIEQNHEAQLKEQEEAAQKEINDLHNKLEEELEKGLLAEQHVQDLEQEINKLEEDFEEEVNDYEAKIKELTEQALKSANDHDITSRASVSSPEKYAEITRLQGELEEREKEIFTLQQQLSGTPNYRQSVYKPARADQREQRDPDQEQLEMLQQQCQDQEQDIQTLRSENEELKTQIQGLEQRGSSSEEQQELRNELKRQVTIIEEKDAQIGQLSDDLTEKTKQLEEMTQTVNKLSSQLPQP